MKLKGRIVSTIVLFLSMLFIVDMFKTVRSSLMASMAVNQLKDSIVIYSFTQKIITSDWILLTICLVFIFTIVLIWYKPIKRSLSLNEKI